MQEATAQKRIDRNKTMARLKDDLAFIKPEFPGDEAALECQGEYLSVIEKIEGNEPDDKIYAAAEWVGLEHLLVEVGA